MSAAPAFLMACLCSGLLAAAAATAIGEVKVECQLTGSGNTIRTVLLVVEIVNLR